MTTNPLQKLPLDLDLEEFIGLTDWTWVRDGRPTMTGFYKTRRRDAPELSQPQRRWFDGQGFSIPILLGQPDTIVEMRRQVRCSPSIDEQIEWCGLRFEPAGYYTSYKPRVIINQEQP